MFGKFGMFAPMMPARSETFDFGVEITDKGVLLVEFDRIWLKMVLKLALKIRTSYWSDFGRIFVGF